MIVGRKMGKEPERREGHAEIGREIELSIVEAKDLPVRTYKKKITAKMYAWGSRRAWNTYSRSKCLERPTLSLWIVSRSQAFSPWVRNVAFSGYYGRTRVRATSARKVEGLTSCMQK